jgi:hypothetical protein
MEVRRRKAVTNEVDTKDHIGRGRRKVNDKIHKGKVAKNPAQQPSMKRPRKIETPGKGK